jgi:hypothetical protein
MSVESVVVATAGPDDEGVLDEKRDGGHWRRRQRHLHDTG